MLGYMAVGQARFMLARAYCAEAFALAAAAEDSRGLDTSLEAGDIASGARFRV